MGGKPVTWTRKDRRFGDNRTSSKPKTSGKKSGMKKGK